MLKAVLDNHISIIEAEMARNSASTESSLPNNLFVNFIN